MSIAYLIFMALAGLSAGFVNAIAGGGTLISFPVLIALGVSPITANVSNTVALTPGYLGGVISQREQLIGSGPFKLLLMISSSGGLFGGLLLLMTPEKVFGEMIPRLLFFASFLLLIQALIGRKIKIGLAIQTERKSRTRSFLALMCIFFASVYGGYFGAGLGIILFSTLTLISKDGSRLVSAKKQLVSLAINITAASLFVLSGHLNWWVVAIVSPCSLIGGMIGGRLVQRIPQAYLQTIVVSVGFSLSAYYWLK